MLKVDEVLKYDLDPIPKYLLMRDGMKLDSKSKNLIRAKEAVLQSKWVKDIVKLQWEDGSWGEFHSLSQSAKSLITTEQALRRLLVLGLDKNDEVIQKPLVYMEKYLCGELDLRDRKEKKHDWNVVTKLFVATWILIFDPSNSLAKGIAEDWAKVITHGFSGGEYNHNAYKEAYYEVHKASKEKHMLGFQSFYLVSILRGMLSSQIESKFLDYIINSEKGIYYIYEKSLIIPPSEFNSKVTSRYVDAYELLSSYTYAKTNLQYFKSWINNNVSEDGFWDMGNLVKDKIYFPLSDSWRKPINRKIDCTIKIQRILENLKVEGEKQ